MGKDKRGKQGFSVQGYKPNDVGGTKLIVKPKRGKDIKTFADLPPDVQEVIHKLSTIDGKIDQTVKANRTAIAINYQHLFPDRTSPPVNLTQASTI